MIARIVRRTFLSVSLSLLVGTFAFGSPSEAHAKSRRADINTFVAIAAATKLPRGIHPQDAKALRGVAALLRSGKRQAAMTFYQRALTRNRGRLYYAAKKQGDAGVLSRWVVRSAFAKPSSKLWASVDKLRFYRQQKQALWRHTKALRRTKDLAKKGRRPTRVQIMRAAPYAFGAAAVRMSVLSSPSDGAMKRSADNAELERKRAEQMETAADAVIEEVKEGAAAAKEMWKLALQVLKECADRQRQAVQALTRI